MINGHKMWRDNMFPKREKDRYIKTFVKLWDTDLLNNFYFNKYIELKITNDLNIEFLIYN